MHVSDRQPTYPSPFGYAFIMVVLATGPQIVQDPGYFSAVAYVFGYTLAAYTGIDLFRQAWRRSVDTKNQFLSAIWLTAYGSVGLFLLKLTEYADFETLTAERSVFARLEFEVQTTYWAIGGFIFILLGLILFGRAIALRPKARKHW